MIEKPRLGSMQTEKADRPCLDHQRKCAGSGDASAEESVAVGYVGVVREIVPYRRLCRAQRPSADGACLRVLRYGHGCRFQVRDARSAARDPFKPALGVEQADMRAYEAAHIHGNAANLVEQGLTLAQAHQGRVDLTR